MTHGGWQTLYRDAVLETDHDKLMERIEAAEKSMAERSLYGKELTAGECLALETSLYQLRTLKQERAKLQQDAKAPSAP